MGRCKSGCVAYRLWLDNAGELVVSVIEYLRRTGQHGQRREVADA